ncbi:MAG: bifunctional folylpolyglutamate synthase/dihydrofolate synthase [Alphaproteobacteria bacterium]|nr:bifunctional folylpolyglutamate synthase/dihydrofolate synthase [Alphaproteobacteria bacterium]
MPHWPKPFWYSQINFGFERIEPVLKVLDNPHLKLPPIIHVAGTNGKGSTVSFIRKILETSGKKVHTYTSPHLVEFNERIVIAGKKTSDEYLYEIIERTRIAAENLGIQCTFFEATTAAAFIAFSENPADYLILETGMGGRLDATNIVENKIATVITPISYDHTEFLGKTLSLIAKEKAAIMRPNTPCIISMQTDEAFDSIEEYATSNNSPTLSFGYDWGVEKTPNGFIYKSTHEETEFRRPSLPGDHQIINAATAITCIKAVTNIDNNTIDRAIQSTYWTGRLENITSGYFYNKYTSFANIWLDGAHNASGAQVLGEWLAEQELPTYMILGMTRNRNIEDFLSFTGKHLKGVFGIYVEDEPSSYKADIVSERAKTYGMNAFAADNLDDAFIQIQNDIKMNGFEKANILVTGSLFLVGMFLRLNKF